MNYSDEFSIVSGLTHCFSDQMNDICPEFKDLYYCKKVKRFMKACPDAKPRTNMAIIEVNVKFQNNRN